MAPHIRFGRFMADLGSGRLTVDGRPIDLEPQPRKLLLHLIRHRHRVVSKQELIEEVFGRSCATNGALARAITKVRQPLEDHGAGAAVSNVPRVGYRFVAKVDAPTLDVDVLNRAFDETTAAAMPRDPLAAEAYFRARQAEAAERTAAAVTLYRLAHELEPDHTGIALGLLRGLARFAHSTTELCSMVGWLLVAADATGDRATKLRVHRVLAFWRLRRNEADGFDRELRRVIELADGSGGARFWAEVHLLQAHAARNRARLAEAREHAERSRRLFRDAGDRAAALRALMLESGLIGGQQAVDLAWEAARGARELGLPFTLATACNSACRALIDAGRLEQAMAHAAEGFAAAVSVGERGIAEELVEGCALACRLAGWPTAAARALAELDALPGLPCHGAVVSLARGLCHSGRGEWTQAAGHLGHAFERAGTAYLRAHILPWHIEALMLTGRPDEAQAALERTDPSLRPNHNFATLLLLLRAALAHLHGAPHRALELLGEALAQGPAPMWRTWACVDAAWLHAQAGQGDTAAQLLAQVDPTLAKLPVVVATRARVLHAAGDVRGALALHRQYLAARKEPGWNACFDTLGAEYERQCRAGIEPLPTAALLPSRAC
jgi:DNA-binding winged helix-turn-helix (wHTH) protein